MLDRTDLKILTVLQREGRISNSELAERVALTPAPCLRRVQRLEQAGVIEGYGARLDPRRLGLGLRAFVRVQLETHDADHVQRFAELVGSAEEVVACWSLTGEMDYLLQVAVTNLDHYNDFIMGRLLREGGVRDVNSSFVLGTIKPDQGLPLPARSD
ncbi:MAG: Lrp/AsnC family transcriptional regulator [Xanthomonadales bacterium]|nr:Lrp/AsnC family transcriptional regulator [Xanthomonadales bacterium]MCB1637027.1 Lrp/AsnC family transcriptional regulator [Xanthomonadales bacterium]